MRGYYDKRNKHPLAIGTLVLIFIGLPLISGCGSSSSSSASGCSINYQDTQIQLSSGGVSCAQVEQERASLGELWQSGGIAENPVTPGVADPPQTACVLTMNGQKATISYGSTFGLASEADLICTGFTSGGWTQQ